VKGPSQSLSIRAADAADEPFLRRLDADRRAGDLGSLPLPPAQLAALLQTQFRARRQGYAAAFPDAAEVLALLDDAPVGYLLVDTAPEVVRIVDVAVLRSHRCRGIGTALVLTVLEGVRGAGRPVRLRASAHDARLLAWYLRLGFSVTDRSVPDVEMTWSVDVG